MNAATQGLMKAATGQLMPAAAGLILTQTTWPLSPFFMSFKTEGFLFYIEVELIYNFVLVSAVQQSDSVIHISIFFSLFSHSSIIEY